MSVTCLPFSLVSLFENWINCGTLSLWIGRMRLRATIFQFQVLIPMSTKTQFIFCLLYLPPPIGLMSVIIGVCCTKTLARMQTIPGTILLYCYSIIITCSSFMTTMIKRLETPVQNKVGMCMFCRNIVITILSFNEIALLLLQYRKIQ